MHPTSTRRPFRAPLAGLAPRRRLFVLGAVVVLLVIVTLGSIAVAREYAVPARAAPGSQGPVVLVPGYGGNRVSLQPLAARLRAAGRETHIVDLPDGGTGDLAAQAAEIDDTVRDLLRRDDGETTSVDLVGYSAGGVASWLYLRTGRTAPAVRRIVTLGSPLRGAELAAAGGALVPGACPRACQQLAPGSSLLAQLTGAPRPPIPWLSVWTSDDETVTPPDSAALPGTTAVRLQSVCTGAAASHSQLPSSRPVVGMVLRALGTDPLRGFSDDDCRSLSAQAGRIPGPPN